MMKNTQSFIASYTGLQAIVTAPRNELHFLVPNMYEETKEYQPLWRERTGKIHYSYNGRNLLATVMMDDGQFSAVVIPHLSPETATQVIKDKTVLIRYTSTQATFPIRKSQRKNKTQIFDDTPRTVTLYSGQLEQLISRDVSFKGKTYTTCSEFWAKEKESTNVHYLITKIKQYLSPQRKTLFEQQELAHAFVQGKPHISLTDPAGTFLSYMRLYKLLDHEQEIHCGKKREAAEMQMNQALSYLLDNLMAKKTLLRTYISQVEEIVNDNKSAEENIEEYHHKIHEFLPLPLENTAAVLSAYRQHLNRALHGKTTAERLDAFNSLPWKKNSRAEIIKECLRSVLTYTEQKAENTHVSQSSSRKTLAHQQNLFIWAAHYLTAEEQYRQAVNTFVTRNTRLLVKSARHYISRGYELSDLLQYGIEGLHRGAEKYDWRKGYKFSTYVSWWIWQSMERAISNEMLLIRLPVHINEARNKVLKFCSTFWQEQQRDPSLEEITQGLGYDVDKVKFMLLHNKKSVSLDQKIGEDEESSLIEFINGSDDISLEGFVHVPESPERVSQRRMQSQKVRKILSKLHPREEKIIRLRFGFGPDTGLYEPELTLEEVGQQFDVTRERIRQIEAKALRKISNYLGCWRLSAHNDGHEREEIEKETA